MSNVKSFHAIESQLYFLFCKLLMFYAYFPTELLDFACHLYELLSY